MRLIGLHGQELNSLELSYMENFVHGKHEVKVETVFGLQWTKRKLGYHFLGNLMQSNTTKAENYES